MTASWVEWAAYRAQEPDYPNVTVHDYRVLMQVMQTVAHELAHLLFLTEDNSKEHSDAGVPDLQGDSQIVLKP